MNPRLLSLFVFTVVAPLVRGAEVAPPLTLPFVDEFDRSHDWAMENATWIAKMKDGRFVCENLNPAVGHLNWAARQLPLANGRDFEILTRVKMVEGAPTGVASIVWDGASTDKKRFFEIADTGTYLISKVENGVWFNARTNIPSKLIKKGEDNDLAIRVIGARVYYFINGSAVDSVDFAGPADPWVGLVTPSGCINSFDRFEVRYIDGPPEKRLADAQRYETEAQAARLASGPAFKDLVEPFDNNARNWTSIGEGATWTGKIAGGVLEWQNRSTGSQITRIEQRIYDDLGNYDLSVRVRHVAGATDNVIGLQWGVTANDHEMLQIGMAASGHWQIAERVGNKFQDIIPWQKTTLVKTGEFNELRVRKLGKTLYCYVNGQVLADVPSRPLVGSQLKLVVSGGMTAAFDDLKISYPTLSETEVAQETAKAAADLKLAHDNKALGARYSVSWQSDVITIQAKADMQRLEDERWKLTDADKKELAKVRKQLDGKKMLALIGSWGRPRSVSQTGHLFYYNYKLVGRTQYYYEIKILKNGDQKDWVIDDVQHTDRTYP